MKDRLNALKERVGGKCDAVLLLTRSGTPDMNVLYYAGLDPRQASAAFYYKFGSSPFLLMGDTRHSARIKKIERKKEDDLYKKVTAKKVGIDAEHMSVAQLDRLKKKTKAKFIDISKDLKRIRMLKDKREMKKIGKACDLSRSVLTLAVRELRNGTTEIDLFNRINEYYYSHGASPAFYPIVASGKNGLYIHTFPTNKKVEKSELVIVDTGARLNGYCSDLTKTFCLNPDRKQKDLIEKVKNITKCALDEVHVGVKAVDVYETVRKLFGNYAKYWKYGLGHGIGLDVHEFPSLALDSEDVLEEGMVFTIEPGLAIPRLGGIRFEYTGVLTKNGFRKL